MKRVAIACAVWLAVGTKASSGATWAMKQPWMHIKLTLVVLVVFSLHGLLRGKLGAYRRGKETKPLPGATLPVLSISVAVLHMPKSPGAWFRS